MAPSTEDLMSPMRGLPTVPHCCSGTQFPQHHGLQPCGSFTLDVFCGDRSVWEGPTFSSFLFELQLFQRLDVSGTVLPPIPTYAGDTRSLLGRKSQQGRDGSSLGRDLGHVTGRGQRTRFLFHLKKPDFVCRKCLEADTHGQGHCIMEKILIGQSATKLALPVQSLLWVKRRPNWNL